MWYVSACNELTAWKLFAFRIEPELNSSISQSEEEEQSMIWAEDLFLSYVDNLQLR